MSPASIPFTKMHGAGNDYVYVDATQHPQRIEQLSAEVIALSDRHTGIGADGLIIISKDTSADAAIRMLMWNADGSRGALCVNGLRCAAWFARACAAVDNERFVVETDAGLHPVQLLSPPGPNGSVQVEVSGIRVATQAQSFTLLDRDWQFYAGDAGNPHAVVFVPDDPETVEVETLGQALQSHPSFVDGVNVEVVRVIDRSAIQQRTFERGSGETQACGSGAMVAAHAAVQTGHCDPGTVRVQLRGGDLWVRAEAEGRHSLRGPVATVFEGRWPVGADCISRPR